MIHALALLALVVGAHSAAADARSIDYLHIEANEGGSSGGHVALRLGAETFHFQQEEGGLIRMRRDDSQVFDFRYAMLGNRPIHETRIAVSDETYVLLRDVFNRRLLVQAAQYERLAALQGDVDLFEQWQRRASTAAVAVPVRGAGYFRPDGFPIDTASSAQSPALASLHARVAAAHGDAFTARRKARIRAGLTIWQPRAVRVPAPALARDEYPHFAPTASTDYREQLEGLTALEVLAAAPALRPEAWRADARALDEHERRTLARFADELTADLAALAASPRADFGYPLLLGMARLAAIDASLASGRLVTLDAFAVNAPAVPLPGGRQRAAYLDALAAQVGPTMERARREFFAQDRFREADYAHLETAANRVLEVERARRYGTPMRMERGFLRPARPALRTALIAPALPEATVRSELDAARAAAADHRVRLAELYGYNLVTRNCVSEIFATLDAALTDAGGGAGNDAAAGESRRRLGGVVRMQRTLNFIPVVSAAAVERSYATVAQRTRPSYRQLRLSALAADEPAWRVSLREANTLTSTIYHAGPRDSAFLFFTDGSVALRPLLGAANLLVGIADSVLGLATWPADRGARLQAGLRGALFSLPELAFVNIRKGSMAWVEPELTGSSPARATVADRGVVAPPSLAAGARSAPLRDVARIGPLRGPIGTEAGGYCTEAGATGAASPRSTSW